jgi:hypothetical protein
MKVAVVLIVIAIQLHFATAPPSPGVWGSIGKGFGKGFSWVGKKVFRIAPKVVPKVVQPVTVAQKAVGPKLTTALTKWQKLLPKRSSQNSLFKTFARKLKTGTKAKYIAAAAATNKFARKIGSRSQVFRRYTKRTFQKLMRKIKNKVNPKGKGKVRADDEMATPLLRDELGEPLLNTAPLSGGPNSPPPAKKMTFKSVAMGVVRSLGVAAEMTGQATSIAMQVQSIKTMAAMNKNSETEVSHTGEGTSASASASALSKKNDDDDGTSDSVCEILPNAFISKHEQECITLSTDSESDEPPPVIQRTKVTKDLVITYQDTTTKSKKSFCRQDVKCPSDKRAGFIQALKPKDILTLTSNDIEFNREASLTCEDKTYKIPLCTLRSGEVRTSQKKRWSIPERQEKGVKRIEWFGVSWHTPKIKNTCHMDTFLTHMTFKCRIDPKYPERNFVIPQHGYEGILREICKEYIALPRILSEKTRLHYHEHWKTMWIKFADYARGNLLDQNKAVDYPGSETSSIVENLEHSNLKFFSYICPCDEKPVKIKTNLNVYTLFTIEQIITLSRERQTNDNEYKLPLNMKYEDAAYNWCKKCKGDVTINYIFVPATTWMIYLQLPSERISGAFSLQGKAPKAYIFDIFKVPKTFVAHELYLETHVEFELGYISLSTTVKIAGITHHLSLQYFNSKFYYYDDMDQGKLVLASDPNALIISKKLSVTAIVYFRP